MKNLLKRILNAISNQKEPAFTEEQFKSFFRSPVWIALRQAVSRYLDSSLEAKDSAKTLEALWKSQGLVEGLLFLMQPESIISQFVTDNQEELTASSETERRLRELLQLWEKEHEVDEQS